MFDIKILFENEDFLIIDKPSGIVVHPFPFSSENTLVDFLFKYNAKIFEIKNEKILQDERKIIDR